MHSHWTRVVVSLACLALSCIRIEAATGASVENAYKTDSPTALTRELDRFRTATVSLSGALDIYNGLHAGIIAADVSFDGAGKVPNYIIRGVQSGLLWQDRIDASNGYQIEHAVVANVALLAAQDMKRLKALVSPRFQITDAVALAEESAGCQAISAGLTEVDSAVAFSVVVLCENRLQQVLLKPQHGIAD